MRVESEIQVFDSGIGFCLLVSKALEAVLLISFNIEEYFIKLLVFSALVTCGDVQLHGYSCL